VGTKVQPLLEKVDRLMNRYSTGNLPLPLLKILAIATICALMKREG
jgi:hypothetical protein